jgi:hypothetical protein
MENSYKWKIPSFAKNINPDDVVKELSHIKEKYGKLNPEFILKSAKSKKSILHSLFEWDNNKAAEQYRLQQVRCIINNIEVIIISDKETFNIPVYEIISTKDEGRQYKHIETLTFDEIEQVKNTTLESLKQLSHKLSLYKKFDKVIDHLQEAIKILSKEE